VMSSAEARARLANLQATLVLNLVEGTEAPAGFDAERVRAAAEALARKRMREAARAWPALVKALGGGLFRQRFTEFAARTPRPARGGPLADGHTFARELLHKKEWLMVPSWW